MILPLPNTHRQAAVRVWTRPAPCNSPKTCLPLTYPHPRILSGPSSLSGTLSPFQPPALAAFPPPDSGPFKGSPPAGAEPLQPTATRIRRPAAPPPASCYWLPFAPLTDRASRSRARSERRWGHIPTARRWSPSILLAASPRGGGAPGPGVFRCCIAACNAAPVAGAALLPTLPWGPRS